MANQYSDGNAIFTVEEWIELNSKFARIFSQTGHTWAEILAEEWDVEEGGEA